LAASHLAADDFATEAIVSLPLPPALILTLSFFAFADYFRRLFHGFHALSFSTPPMLRYASFHAISIDFLYISFTPFRFSFFQLSVTPFRFH
jgi:hypothetical protein